MSIFDELSKYVDEPVRDELPKKKKKVVNPKVSKKVNKKSIIAEASSILFGFADSNSHKVNNNVGLSKLSQHANDLL